MAKKILITGGCGFIGNQIVKDLMKNNYNVSVIDIKKGIFPVKYFIADISNKEQILKIIKDIQPDIIIHLAALITGSYDDLYKINVIGTKNIQESFSGKIIFMSSAMIYQGLKAPFKENFIVNPTDNYAKTKKKAEDILLKNNQTIILRGSIVYGLGQKGSMFIPQLKYHIKNNLKFHMTKGEQKRDFIHVKDLTNAILKLIETNNSGIFNIGFGKSITLKEVIGIAKEIFPKLEIEHSLEYRPNEIMDYTPSIEKIKTTLKWQPNIDLKNGLKELLVE